MKFAFWIILLPCCNILNAQSIPVELWSATEYIKYYNIISPRVVVDKTANTYMLANQFDLNPFGGFTLVKYDTMGQALWNQNYPPEGFGHIPGGFVVDSLGNSYVSLNFNGAIPNYDADVIQLKYAPTGEKIWEKNYGLNQAGDNYIMYSDIDAWGRLIVYGLNDDDLILDNNFLFVAAVDTETGDIIWKAKMPAVVRPLKMRLLEDRIELFFTNFYIGSKTYAIAQVDYNGNILGINEKTYFSNYEIDFNCIAKNGDVVFGNRAWGYHVTRVDQRGDTLWHYAYPQSDATNQNWVRCVIEDDSMNVLATGGIKVNGLYLEMVTTKISPNGEIIWQDVYDLTADSLYDTGGALSADGPFVLAGGAGQQSADQKVGIINVYNAKNGHLEYELALDNVHGDNIDDIDQVILKGNKIFYVGTGLVAPPDNKVHVITGCIQLPETSAVKAASNIWKDVNLSPNPAADIILISGLDATIFKKVEVIDPSGITVLSSLVDRDTLSLDLSRLPSGFYGVKMSGKGVSLTKKIILTGRP